MAHGHQASCKDGGAGRVARCSQTPGTCPPGPRPRAATPGSPTRPPRPGVSSHHPTAQLSQEVPPHSRHRALPPGPRAGNLLRGGDGVWAPEVRTETLWARNQLGKGSASAWGKRGSRGMQPRPGSPHTCSQDSRPAPHLAKRPGPAQAVSPLLATASSSRLLYSWGDRPGGRPPTNRETRGATTLLSAT